MESFLKILVLPYLIVVFLLHFNYLKNIKYPKGLAFFVHIIFFAMLGFVRYGDAWQFVFGFSVLFSVVFWLVFSFSAGITSSQENFMKQVEKIHYEKRGKDNQK